MTYIQNSNIQRLKKPTNDTPIRLKLIIYGIKGTSPGSNIYCKFYHNSIKHKTQKVNTKVNPIWDEWFMLMHVCGRNLPYINMEIWGSTIVGNNIKGAFTIDLYPILEGKEYFLDTFYKVDPNCQLRVKVINLDSFPKVEYSIGALEALASNQIDDPDKSIAALVDEMKFMFPHIPYGTIISMGVENHWRRQMLMTNLSNAKVQSICKNTAVTARRVSGPEAPSENLSMQLKAPQGNTSIQEADYVGKEREGKVDKIQISLPEVERGEITLTLEKNDWDVCLALDELILNHRAMPDINNGPVLGEKLVTLTGTADGGGFLTLEGNEEKPVILHSSMVSNMDKSGPGKDLFNARRNLFEKTSISNKSKPDEN